MRTFKAQRRKDRFTAATSSGFSYTYSPAPFLRSLTIEVSTYFDKRLSYFKRTEREGYVLRHEQVHFDISELYARKFTSHIQSEFANKSDWEDGHEDLYYEIREALYLEQDRYDFEVYADTSLQAGWSSRIANELDLLSEHEGIKKIVLHRK